MRRQKLLAALLALVMVATLLPLTAFAATETVTRWKPIESLEELGAGKECAVVYQGGTKKLLYHGSGTDVTDQLGASISDDILDITTSIGTFAKNTVIWTVAPAAGENGKYTIKSTAGDNKYLDLTDTTDGSSSGKAKVSATVKELTIDIDDDGNCTISMDVNGSAHYLRHNDDEGNNRWFYCDTNNVSVFKIYTEVTETIEVPDPTLAPNHYSSNGVKTTKPMDKAAVNSDYFRIPGITTLSNGWQVAVSDIRWRSSNDNPANMDTIVSISKDNGETWEWETLNYLGDYSINVNSSYSSSFIDPAIVQAADGAVWVAVDMTPFMYGNQRATGLSNNGTGYDESDNNSMLVAYVGEEPDTSVATPKTNDQFAYRIDLSGDHGKETGTDLWEKSQSVYPIYSASSKENTKYYVDAFLNLYEKDDAGNITGVQCKQYGATGENYYTQNNLLYAQCSYRLFPTFYFCLRKGIVNETAGTIEWEDPIYPNVRNNLNTFFFGVCPGRGTVVKVNGVDRIVFQCYDNGTRSTEYASAFYSDNNGVTWQRGGHADQMGTSGGGKSSESQTIVLPDGKLRMYSRNNGSYITYTDSPDGGETWGVYQKDNSLSYTGNCMVSFINVDGTLVDSTGKEYKNLIMGSYPKVNYRLNGAVRIGYIDEADNQVHWFEGQNFDTQLTGTFQYSCLTQARNSAGEGLDKFGILYEPNDAKGVACEYKTFTVASVLGADYYLKPVVPTAEEVATLLGEVTFVDNNEENKHEDRSYAVPADSVKVTGGVNEEEGSYVVDVVVDLTALLNQYNDDSRYEHDFDGSAANIDVKLTYVKGTGWTIPDGLEKEIHVACQTPVTPPVVTPPAIGGGATQVPDEEPPLDAEPDDGADIPDDSTPLAPAPDDGDTDIEDGDTPLDSTPKTGDDSIAIAVLWSIFSLSAIGFVSVMLSMKKAGKHSK